MLGSWKRLPVFLGGGVLASINKDQIKIIYTLGNELNLVDKGLEADLLHELVFSYTGKWSIKDILTWVCRLSA